MKKIILLGLAVLSIVSCVKDKDELIIPEKTLVESIYVEVFTRTYATTNQKVFVNNTLALDTNFISSCAYVMNIKTGDSIRVEVESNELIGNKLLGGDLGTTISSSFDDFIFEKDFHYGFKYEGDNIYPFEYEIDYNFNTVIPFKN